MTSFSGLQSFFPATDEMLRYDGTGGNFVAGKWGLKPSGDDKKTKNKPLASLTFGFLVEAVSVWGVMGNAVLNQRGQN